MSIRYCDGVYLVVARAGHQTAKLPGSPVPSVVYAEHG